MDTKEQPDGHTKGLIERLEAAVELMEKAATMMDRGEMPVPGCQYSQNWSAAHRTLLAALSSQASVMEEMAKGLERFDATSAMCPFNRSPTPPKDKPCPTCGAEKSEGCRREITGAFGLVYTVRTALSQYRTLGGE